MPLLILAAFLIGAAVLVVLEVVSPADRKGPEAARIVRAWASESESTRRRRRRRRTNPLKPLCDYLLYRSTSEATRTQLRDRLAAAGVGASLTPADFVSIRFGLVILGALGGVVVGSAAGTASVAFMLCIGLAVVGYVLPGSLLDRRARARRDRVDEALPDALDLLAVTVEAGVGLYGAIVKVVESTEGALADEFGLCLAEMRVGESSSNALKHMAARTGSGEVRSMVRTMIQGEELGFSLAKTLRGLAEDARRRRQAIAEERASKAPVKMLVPAAIFIFPALFVVILGPAALTLKTLLG
jgi:tight adherence protein C